MPHNVYYWNAKNNFGDRLTPWMLYRLSENHVHKPPADAGLVGAGSILEHLPAGWKGTVAGAGLLRPESRVDLSAANVLGLRGKLTAKRVTGVDKKITLGDPGLLASKFVSHFGAKHDLGIVAHWSDTELVKRFPHAHVIDVTKHPEYVVGEIARCRKIISSSLHGLVVADSFGIPRQAELFAQAAKEGGDFKFRDYASVFDGDPHFGETWTAPHDVVERLQRELWAVLMEALGLPIPKPFPEPPRRRRGGCRPEISILVPFRDDGEHRARVWHWLKKYWRENLPEAEIVEGHDSHAPFSKAAAVNWAAERARGKVFVIADADTFIDTRVVKRAADRIIHAVKHHRRLWYVPYSHLYRLTEGITEEFLDLDPRCPFWIPSPPPPQWIECGNASSYGHKFGALITIMPREAFFIAGGFDPRFRGWGSEDAAFLRAVDTLYAPHELTHNDVFHLWHERIGDTVATRKWVGQITGSPNSRLAQRYGAATGEVVFMRGLTRETPVPRQALSWDPRTWL